jgi:hypothetical protein
MLVFLFFESEVSSEKVAVALGLAGDWRHI